MNSLGSSSKWPSYDSLPSTSSFLLSESDQTEDEADVFSEGEGYSGRAKFDQPKHCFDETKHPNSATLDSCCESPGDLAFAQKCADLHRFIHPLLELLHGLKSGRFDKGLTSFQQSVAIDRLQRILGILQKPEMGEKFLHNLLQIEMMLKIWFPQVACRPIDTPNKTTTPRCSQNWQQNQLHMPVKKRKLSWSDPVPIKHKHHQHEKHVSCQAAASLHTVSACLPGSPKRQKIPEEETAETSEDSCRARHEFTDSTGALSRPFFYSKRKYEKHYQISLTFPCGSLATQDSLVSSTDSITTDDSP